MGSTVMSGKLDEISLAIGRIQAGLENVSVAIQENRDTAERRHTDNLGRFDEIGRTLAPLKSTVEKMTPIVEGIQITRWKMAGAITVGSLFLAGVGWAITMLAGKITTWALSLIK